MDGVALTVGAGIACARAAYAQAPLVTKFPGVTRAYAVASIPIYLVTGALKNRDEGLSWQSIALNMPFAVAAFIICAKIRQVAIRTLLRVMPNPIHGTTFFSQGVRKMRLVIHELGMPSSTLLTNALVPRVGRFWALVASTVANDALDLVLSRYGVRGIGQRVFDWTVNNVVLRVARVSIATCLDRLNAEDKKQTEQLLRRIIGDGPYNKIMNGNP